MKGESMAGVFLGGFQDKMDRREATRLLGLKNKFSTKDLKTRHMKMMIINHPDRSTHPSIFHSKKLF